MIPYYAVTVYVAVMSGLSAHVSRHFIHEREKAISLGKETKPISPATWTIFDLFIVAGLIAFSALRFRVGSDYDMYTRFYEGLLPGQWAEQIAASPQEAGYTALSLYVKSISDSPHAIFWVTSAITVIPAYAAIKKRSTDPTMSVLLYILLAFFVSPFNIIRQGIAVSLNFWANTFIEKNKTAFVIINAIAATFHASALIVAVIQLIIHKWKPTKKKAITGLVLAAAAAASLQSFPIIGVWLDKINGRYDSYLGAGTTTAGIGTYLVAAVTLALLAYAAWLGNVQANGTYFMYVLVGAAFLIIGTQAIAIARMQFYFGIFLILLLPNQMKQAGRNDTEKIALIAAACIYFGFYLAEYGGLVPYQTYFGAP